MQNSINTRPNTFQNEETKWIIYLSIAIITSIIFAFEDFLNTTNIVQVWIELFICIPLLAISFIIFSTLATFSVKSWQRLTIFSTTYYNDIFWAAIWVLVVGFLLSLLYKPVVAILPIDHNINSGNLDNRWLIWSISLLFASVVMVVEHFWKLLIKRQQLELINHTLKRNDELVKYKALVQQINPHFLFNSLNALSVLVHKNPHDAERFIEELSKIYRYILQLNASYLVPLKKELAFVESYIFLQRIRYRENLQFHSTVNAQSINYMLPPLTLELLIENAIKHNAIGSETPLTIELIVENDYLLVRNKIQLRMESEIFSTKVGLKNLTDKYAILGDKTPAFLIENGQFIAKIPLLKQEQECAF